MVCSVYNYTHLVSDDAAKALEDDSSNTVVTLMPYYDATEINHWLRGDEAHGWVFFGSHRGKQGYRVTFSDAPTAVAFKLRFG